MADHDLFYYPYSSLTDQQLPLLKVAALYFDKLYMLDPVGASWATIGADYWARDAIQLLEHEGILQILTPAEVLAKHSAAMKEAIVRDMRDPEFLQLCDRRGNDRWTLSLAKVPDDLLVDQEMRELMGDFARRIAGEAGAAIGDYVENRVALSYLPGNEEYRDLKNPQAEALSSFGRTGRAYDEFREGYGGDVEYRYADFPLPLGESIMMNHALFAGLLHAEATPVTDDLFHSQALSLKLQHAAQDPEVRQVQLDRSRSHKAGRLAFAALTDPQLALPVLNASLPLDEVLEYRQKHNAELKSARDKLGWMARRIESEPWTDDFAKEIDRKTIPDIAAELDEVGRARDSWLSGNRPRLALAGAGVVVGAATAMLSVLAAPLTPVALVAGGLGLASGAAIPGAQLLSDWRSGRKTAKVNGLHYLLKV